MYNASRVAKRQADLSWKDNYLEAQWLVVNLYHKSHLHMSVQILHNYEF